MYFEERKSSKGKGRTRLSNALSRQINDVSVHVDDAPVEAEESLQKEVSEEGVSGELEMGRKESENITHLLNTQRLPPNQPSFLPSPSSLSLSNSRADSNDTEIRQTPSQDTISSMKMQKDEGKARVPSRLPSFLPPSSPPLPFQRSPKKRFSSTHTSPASQSGLSSASPSNTTSNPSGAPLGRCSDKVILEGMILAEWQ